MTELVERLAAATSPVPGLPLGSRAPDFTLPDANGRDVRLAEWLRAGPVVLSFYRGGQCSDCERELRSYQDALPEFDDLGASVLAVGPEDRTAALSTKDGFGLGFPVLSDVAQRVISEYGVGFALPEDLRGHVPHDSLPIPATFVLDRQGVVRARHLGTDLRSRMSPEEALSTVEAITLG